MFGALAVGPDVRLVIELRADRPVPVTVAWVARALSAAVIGALRLLIAGPDGGEAGVFATSAWRAGATLRLAADATIGAAV